MAALRMVNATKRYPNSADGDSSGRPALDGFTYTFEDGELVALVGRSGCGKTTLLNLAGAMDFPSSGEVWIHGELTTGLDDAGLTRLRRTSIGFIFQSFQLLPTLSVVENVELPLLLAGASHARERAKERLDWVEMGEFASRMTHQLSGGQMQRVAIARALVHNPKLLLADEPIGNLDTTTGNVVLNLLRRAAREQGATVLMATHSAESTAIADTIIRLRDGVVEEMSHPSCTC
ncbi:MAG: ABC transporter ATP-binding protein [Bryobacterales bacterium]|nr:ABC transporter ATP-binding protein [Bryobacterales bacterium]